MYKIRVCHKVNGDLQGLSVNEKTMGEIKKQLNLNLKFKKESKGHSTSYS